MITGSSGTLLSITIIWVLECLSLCNPTDALRKTWGTKEECRQAVIHTMNGWEIKDRFPWRCIAMRQQTIELKELKAEDLEKD